MMYFDLTPTFIVLGLFIVIVVSFIIARSFWKTLPDSVCSYCKGEITNCKITVTNDSGTKVFCDPYCVEQGLKGNL